MIELKFREQRKKESIETSSLACSCSMASQNSQPVLMAQPCAPSQGKGTPAWVIDTVMTPSGSVHRVSSELERSERREHLKCRVSAFRNSYTVPPGLYAVGRPDRSSDVLVSANYKLSFDTLRRELKGLNGWLLVLDTKGINVWCAAGKGTFGTDELVRRITLTRLDEVVDHRRVIVPQLGAPGVSAHKVREATGFRIYFGPVYAKDIPAYLRAGYKASREMRTIKFPLLDRLVLSPMEINPAMKRYPVYALIILFVFGLQPSGIIFKDATMGGMPYLLLGLVTILSGAFLTPVLLPFIPFRAFALKGWIVGFLTVFLSMQLFSEPNLMLLIFTYLFFPLASSYIALQFTGSTTFTGMTGVKKELKFAMPAYIFFGALSVVLLIAYKLGQWGVL